MKINYHKVMLKEIEKLKQSESKKKLLLHSCCGPCSSYVLEYLSDYFDITVIFFNPNIYPLQEYEKRLEEQIRLIKDMNLPYEVVGKEHEEQLFYEAVKGYEDLGEFSERCFRCYHLRLERTAQYAKANHFDYFTTTLSISPLKNVNKINEMGLILQAEYGIKFLQADFKKNNGFKRSTEMSKEYHLYRQDYCGCVFSKEESRRRKNSDVSVYKKNNEKNGELVLKGMNDTVPELFQMTRLDHVMTIEE